LSKDHTSASRASIKIQQSNQLLEADWQDAEQGVYPKSLLFDNPGSVRYYPMVWLDMPQIWERANQKKYQDFFRQRLRGSLYSYLQNYGGYSL